MNLKDKYENDKDNNIPEWLISAMTAIGYHKLNTGIWEKIGALIGTENSRPNGNWEYVYVFVKDRKNYTYNPIKIYNDKELELVKCGGQRNSDGTKTPYKLQITKPYEVFGEYTEEQKFIDLIKSRNAGKDSAFIKKEYGEDHPAVYPLFLPLFYILQFSNEGDWVTDAFAGSGTTAIASLLSLRKAIAIDIEPKFTNLIIKRSKNLSKEFQFEPELAKIFELNNVKIAA